jgi:uncharacterized membrane protein YhaH (DUF805 family)
MLASQVLIVAACMALEAVPEGPLLVVLNLFFLWLTTTIVIKRLHDIGRSAWTLAASTIGVVVWSVVLAIGLVLVMPKQALLPGAIGYMLAVLGTALPVLVGILWLHCAPGMAGANRFGAEPAGNGFSPRPQAWPKTEKALD